MQSIFRVIHPTAIQDGGIGVCSTTGDHKRIKEAERHQGPQHCDLTSKPTPKHEKGSTVVGD